ncbi:Cytochrome P450 monooxygenase AKT7 [Paramyrothecium foliicola]|nr:Cytochrome P450 monooxygenase AKT7 [Paramyrothecium foliicola]
MLRHGAQRPELGGGNVLSIVTYRLAFDPLRKFPGPFIARFSNIYGGLHAAQKQLHLTTYADLKKYGPVYRQGPDRLVFNTINAVQEMLTTWADIYLHPRITKARLYLQTQYEKEHNVFGTMDRQRHQQKRKIYGRLLSDRALRTFEATMHGEIDVFLRQIHKASVSGPVDMSPLCGRLTTDVAGQIGFGQSLGTQTEDVNRVLPKIMTELLGLANVYMAWPTLALLHKLIEILPESKKNFNLWRNALMGIIGKRIALPKHARHDIYSIVSEDFEDGREIPAQEMGEVWGEATFIIPAGGLTTSTAISALFFYLSRHPDIYKKLAAEIRAAFPDSESIKSGPQLTRCAYLRAVIDETLRMASATTITAWREEDPKSKSTEPFVVDGHVIPRGTNVGVNSYCLMHSEEYFPEPFSFKPERWLGNEDSDSMATMRAAFIPFAVGSASCLGKGMAYLEMSLVVAKTLWYFDFEKAPGEAGKLGGGNSQAPHRGRVDEFQLYDALIADHDGPNLVFTPRGDHWKELVRTT